jgi:hypothetical protein
MNLVDRGLGDLTSRCSSISLPARCRHGVSHGDGGEVMEINCWSRRHDPPGRRRWR